MVVFLNVTAEDLEFLKTMGFGTMPTKSQYELVRYGGPCSLILYTSGKLVIQGKEENIRDIVAKLEDEGAEKVKLIEFEDEHGWMIGSDESLKGDTFGGLVVAGVCADDAGRNALRLLGVQDSKSVKDADIAQLADRIKQKVRYSVQVVVPEEYNEFTQTALMNGLHSEVAKELKEQLLHDQIHDSVIHAVDKYPGCTVGHIRVTKGESRYLEIAAASILARDAALSQMRTLGLQAGFVIPKGSTHVAEALQQLKESGLDPKKFVKMHFSNVQRVFGE